MKSKRIKISVCCLSLIFLDERNAPVGESQRNYARFQMEHAGKLEAPVWGWSSSEAPDGRYLSFGELRDDIVSPSASILAAIYFPEDTYENLKNLERLGVRSETSSAFGFRDSINWKTGQVSEHYLTSNQGMIFLSLANLLYDGVVWKSFEADSVVQRGLEILNIMNPLEVEIEKTKG